MATNAPASAETILNGASHQPHTSTKNTQDYDLLPKLIPHLDRHLVFPILQFLETREDVDPADFTTLKYQLLKETNMSDYVWSLEQEIRGLSERPAESVQKREEVIQRRQVLEDETNKMTSLMENSDVTGNLRSDKVANLNYLKENHGVTVEDVNRLYDYAQFLYSVGQYPEAADLLFQYRFLVRPSIDKPLLPHTTQANPT